MKTRAESDGMVYQISMGEVMPFPSYVCSSRHSYGSTENMTSSWMDSGCANPWNSSGAAGWSDRRDGREFGTLIKRVATKDELTDDEQHRLDELIALRREALSDGMSYDMLMKEQERSQKVAEILSKIDAYISSFGDDSV